MHTVMLRAMQLPSQTERLLESLLESLKLVPEDALPLYWSELPSALRQIVRHATAEGQVCCCWMGPGLHVWCFIGELSLELSRKHGVPVLHMKYYRESGLMLDDHWARDRHDNWHRLDEEELAAASVAAVDPKT